ncbi:hypothetical protein AS200_44180 [Streptomyces sp. CdTB01]|nr:hypothetical protein AS200_44180 [Streptomyces sp. CdTB01]
MLHFAFGWQPSAFVGYTFDGEATGVGEAVEGVSAGSAAVAVAVGLVDWLDTAALSPPPEQPASDSTAAISPSPSRTRLCAVVIPLPPVRSVDHRYSQGKLPSAMTDNTRSGVDAGCVRENSRQGPERRLPGPQQPLQLRAALLDEGAYTTCRVPAHELRLGMEADRDSCPPTPLAQGEGKSFPGEVEQLVGVLPWTRPGVTVCAAAIPAS